MSKRARSTRGQASSPREETMEERVRKFRLFDNGNDQMNYNNLVGRSIHFGDVFDCDFLSNKGLARPFFDFINTDTLSGPQWGVTFRIGGVEREMSLLEFGWRVGLYSEGESRDAVMLSGLRNVEMVNATRLTHSFWPSIGDGIVLNCEPPPHVYRKTSLVKIGVIMKLYERECCWPATKGVVEESEGNDEEGNKERGNAGVGGSVDIYHNMSQGDWQVHQTRWMDRQYERWGRIDA
nr:hypothetical protein [Tanacetum cinerariifolium]